MTSMALSRKQLALHHGLLLSITMLMAVLAGMNVVDLEPSFERLLTDEINEWGIPLALLSANLTWKRLLLVGFLAILIVIYINLYLGQVKIDLRRLVNVLVYAYPVAVFFPLLRGSFLIIPIVGLSFLTLPRKKKSYDNARRAKSITGVFGAMTLVQMTLMYWIGANNIDRLQSLVPPNARLYWTLMYMNSIVIYYIMGRNDWGTKQFEKLFKIILVISLIFSIESLATLYAGFNIRIFGGTSIRDGGQFRSALIMSYQVVSILGVCLLFMSLYFFARYRKRRFIATAVCGLLLMASTMSRAPVFGSVLVLATIIIARRRRRLGENRQEATGNRDAFRLLPFAVLFFLAFYQIIVGRGSTFLDRAVRHVRALDVLLYTKGLGTGPGVSEYYAASFLVPPTISKLVLSHLGPDPSPSLVYTRRMGISLDGSGASTLHSFWLKFIIEWGVVGVLAVLYLCRRGWQLLREVSALEGMACDVDIMHLWILAAFALSMSISLLFTSKFPHVWIIVALFLFLDKSVRQTSREIRGEMDLCGSCNSRRQTG